MPAAEREGVPYPWQQRQWRRLTADLAGLPHALLLAGQPGLAKREFARELARLSLCGQPAAGSACGTCKGCLLFRAGTHPDFALTEPAEEGRAITVDQVRALVGFATARPHTATTKVVLLVPAERMNLNAANALLKVLEEPPPDNLFLLVSDDPGGLPPTVRSRCQRVQFSPPAPAEGRAWLETALAEKGDAAILLELSGGAPLAALALAGGELYPRRMALLEDLERLWKGQGDPVACAERWLALGPGASLAWLQGAVADLLKLSMLPTGTAARLANPDLASRLHALGRGSERCRFFHFADTLARARSLLTGPLEARLLLEDILIRWSELRENLRESV